MYHSLTPASVPIRRDVVHTKLLDEIAEMDGVCTNISQELNVLTEHLTELRRIEGVLEEDLGTFKEMCAVAKYR